MTPLSASYAVQRTFDITDGYSARRALRSARYTRSFYIFYSAESTDDAYAQPKIAAAPRDIMRCCWLF